jgi:hypothetical protein
LSTLREWLYRLWVTLRRGRSDEDLAGELHAHMEMAVNVVSATLR